MTAEIKLTSDITVRLVQKVGGDHMVAAAARVSTGGEAALELADPSRADECRGLIRYLMQHRHGTPFESGAMTFFVHAPIFVWREWHRHRIGFCLAGDTQVWADRYDPQNGRVLRKLSLAALCDRWNNGVRDSWGRTRHLKSVRDQTLRVLNEDTHLFEMGTIFDVFQSGVKELFLLETNDRRGFSLRCSRDHRVLTPDGWAAISDLSASDSVYVNGKRNTNEVSVPPSLRRGIGVWTSMQRSKLIRPFDSCYLCGGKFARDDLTLDHVVPVAIDLLKALDRGNLRPACARCHRKKSNGEQALSDRNIVAGSKLVRLVRKPIRVSEEMTYDIAMSGPHHNFVANGIVVHNSYNEESGRYKVLEPVFYVPPKARPMFKVDDWKPGRPKFLPIARLMESMKVLLNTAKSTFMDSIVNQVGEAAYARLCSNLEEVYRLAYQKYEENLALGVDPGLARDCLPVGIYSSCWVTCNPRSLMAFLSLRTHDPEAKYVSYPLYEIEVAARKCEELFAEHWPLTHGAFVECGRVGP